MVHHSPSQQCFLDPERVDDKHNEETVHHEGERFWQLVKTLNCFLTLMPHDEDKDTVFTDTDLKALLLKSVPFTWQDVYLLKGIRSTDDFRQMFSYFIQFQNITDAQGFSKSCATPQNLETKQQHKYSRTKRECVNYNYPCLTNPFLTFYMEQAPESTSPEALSTVMNTDNSNKSNKQIYMF